MRRTSSAGVWIGLMAAASTAWACPICNVDGMLSRNFILVVMGSALTAALMLLFWSIARGHWQDAEAIKFRILELEMHNTVRI